VARNGKPSFGDHVKVVMMKARDGCRYSELSPGQQKAADLLAKQNKITFTNLPDGDWLVNK